MIKLFKLINGETVIGDCERNLDGDWIIRAPHLQMIVPHPSGQMGISLIEYIIGSEDKVTIVLRSSRLMCEPVEPSKSMLNMWDDKIKELLKQSTGIEVVKSF